MPAPEPPPSPDSDPALALVRQGWEHLHVQRPLAAWACWRRALRLAPGHPAASQALDRLESAVDLPAAARGPHALRPPRGEARRARWDAALRGRDLEDLADAASAFAALADADPADGEARRNQALCLAWQGRNAEAVAALADVVDRLAGVDFEAAADAWALAEVLRQGAGAEGLADDLDHVLWVDQPGDLLDRLAEEPGLGLLRPVANPVDPDLADEATRDLRLFEWLDRPMPPADPPPSAPALPRVLATVMATPSSLRLSSPDPAALSEASDRLAELEPAVADEAYREATPLPLALLDAAIWTVRLPAGLDPDAVAGLHRSAVERYYEQAWPRLPRRGLDGRTPAEAASGADPATRARLEGIVRLREQVGRRPRTAALYQGYPFDRLPRRLGLEPVDPDAVDPADAAILDAAGLDALDESGLDDARLAEAFESAAALGDDRRTARFAAALAARPPGALDRVDARALFATLVRAALAASDPGSALDRIDQAEEHDRDRNAGRLRREFAVWRAEVHARSDDPDAALAVYRALLDEPPADPALALDGAETLLDNGYPAHAAGLARLARDLADEAGDERAASRADDLLLGPLAGEDDS